MTSHRAFVDIPGPVLESHLPLPDYTTILDAKWDPQKATLQLLVSNPELPDVSESDAPGRCVLKVTVLMPGGRKIAKFHPVENFHFVEMKKLAEHAGDHLPPEMAVLDGEDT